MLRVLPIAVVAAFSLGGSPPAAAQGGPQTLYGLDFTRPYVGPKEKVDTRMVENIEITLYQIDPGLGGQSYLVETAGGEICEFATVFPIEIGASDNEAFGLLEEMVAAAEDYYGLPSEVSGPEVMISEATWVAGEDGVALPPEVATLQLSLGWSAGAPVAVFLKASHKRCEGLSGLGLP